MCKRHIQAIIDFLQPRNVKELQSFLGLTNYFRRFIKDYALKVSCLQALVKKNAKFIFDKQCVQTVEHLKAELTTLPVLSIYNPLADTQNYIRLRVVTVLAQFCYRNNRIIVWLL